MAPAATEPMLQSVARRAQEAGVFGDVALSPGLLACAAKAPAAPAWYRLSRDGTGLWVSLVTPDRWLSHSIEADLLHTGDKLEELIDEELLELGLECKLGPCQHFRSEDKLFTFRSQVPTLIGVPDHDTALKCLLAYEACFRRLGDMHAQAQDD